MWCTDLTDSAETWVTWENNEAVMSLIIEPTKNFPSNHPSNLITFHPLNSVINHMPCVLCYGYVSTKVLLCFYSG